MGCCDRETAFETESLCPSCFKKIPAVRETRGDDVFLVKRCPEHGEFRTIIWRGKPESQGWKRKPSVVRSSESQSTATRGCPFDYGICPSHRKNACTAVLEITSRCNLRCPVCYADSGSDPTPDPSPAQIAEWYRRVLRAYGSDIIIRLSGGEPKVRDDLPAIIEMGRSLGFPLIQVNTNGLRLTMEKEYASVLRQAGASSVFFSSTVRKTTYTGS